MKWSMVVLNILKIILCAYLCYYYNININIFIGNICDLWFDRKIRTFLVISEFWKYILFYIAYIMHIFCILCAYSCTLHAYFTHILYLLESISTISVNKLAIQSFSNIIGYRERNIGVEWSVNNSIDSVAASIENLWCTHTLTIDAKLHKFEILLCLF